MLLLAKESEATCPNGSMALVLKYAVHAAVAQMHPNGEVVFVRRLENPGLGDLCGRPWSAYKRRRCTFKLAFRWYRWGSQTTPRVVRL